MGGGSLAEALPMSWSFWVGPVKGGRRCVFGAAWWPDATGSRYPSGRHGEGLLLGQILRSLRAPAAWISGFAIGVIGEPSTTTCCGWAALAGPAAA